VSAETDTDGTRSSPLRSAGPGCLATLVDLGFLSSAPEGRRYRLGPRAFQLSNAFQASFQLSAIAESWLAVPVRDQTGAIDTELVISGLTTRYDKPAMERTLAAAQSAAAEISRERGNIVVG